MLYNNVLIEQSRSQLSTELMIYHMQVMNYELHYDIKEENVSTGNAVMSVIILLLQTYISFNY